MSLLNKIDSLQQELWGLCDEDYPTNDAEINSIMQERLILYRPLAKVFHPPETETHKYIELVLLCGISDDNIGTNTVLKPK